MLRVQIHGTAQADSGLRRFSSQIDDLQPFWRELGRDLADEAQARWPLRRRTGRLRRSLMWAGDRLGRGGVFEASPDKLTFGSSLFYSRFHQFGTKRHAARPLIHVDADRHADQLDSWLRARAEDSGLEVKT